MRKKFISVALLTTILKKAKEYLLLIPSLILLAFLVLVLSLHLYFSKDGLSPLETSLFTVLELVISMAFAWVLARYSSKEEFTQSQKKFALSAYRRTKEIEMGIDRLIFASKTATAEGEIELQRNILVIGAIADGVKESIVSSTADWADIIGEEIHTYDEIQAIRSERVDLENPERKVARSQKVDAENEAKHLEKRVVELKTKLPRSLQVLDRESYQTVSELLLRRRWLEEEKSLKGYISVSGFWAEGEFDKTQVNFKAGDRLHVTIADSKGRSGVFIVKDSKGNSVGVIMNKFRYAGGVSYRAFVEIFVSVLGKTDFSIEITGIPRTVTRSAHSKRVYFEAKILE